MSNKIKYYLCKITSFICGLTALYALIQNNYYPMFMMLFLVFNFFLKMYDYMEVDDVD